MLSWNQRQSGVRGSLRLRAQHTMQLLIACQLVIAITLALVLLMACGTSAAYSALVGTVIAIAPNQYLAGRLRRRRPGASPSESLREIYAGELLKIVFTIALFVIAIRLLDVAFLIVVAGYAVMVGVNWCALLVLDLGEVPANVTQA